MVAGDATSGTDGMGEGPVEDRLAGVGDLLGEDQRRLAAALTSARSGLRTADPFRASLEVASRLVAGEDARPLR
jgi:hypothetical protein